MNNITVGAFVDWKKNRAALDRKVVAIADRLKELRAGLKPTTIYAFIQSCGGPSEISEAAAVSHVLWTELESEHKIDSGITLIEGILPGLVEHTWYEVWGKVELVCDPRWCYIIDPCPPDLRPQVPIILNPNSPLRYAYQHHASLPPEH